MNPLDSLMLTYLISLDNEEAFLDFKETLDISKRSAFPKIAKDIFAFANYGGGWIIIGLRRRQRPTEADPGADGPGGNYELVGLPEGYRVDQADLQSKFNAFCVTPITIPYREFFRKVEDSQRKLAAIYIPPSKSVLRPLRNGLYYDKDGKAHLAFKAASVLTRRGTQSVEASDDEKEWIEKRCEIEEYKHSVLSGRPDQVLETLYGNMLEPTKTPETVTTALLLRGPWDR